MQAVDVLGDQRVQPSLALQLHQRPVSRVGLFALPHRTLDQPLPVALAQLGIGHIMREGGCLFRLGVLGPQPLRPPEVGNTAVGRDSCPGEHDNSLRGVQHISGRLDLFAQFFDLTHEIPI